LPGILAQYGIGLVERSEIGQWPDDGQVVGAGATKRGAAFHVFGRQGFGAQAMQQVFGDLPQHRQVARVLGGCGCQVVVLEVETGAEGMLSQACRRDVPFGAHHRSQRFARRGLRQPRDLPANAFEGELAAGGELSDLGGAGQYHHAGAGQQRVAVMGLPLLVDALQLDGMVMGEDIDQRVRRLPLAQRRRVDPATFGEKQPTVGQLDAGLSLSLVAVQQVQQLRRKGLGQLRLTLGFLGVERQLQHAAALPVDTPVQVFQQTPGVAETTQDQLRQRRAVGRQLEVQHTLGVA